jgi:hypothetical protein
MGYGMFPDKTRVCQPDCEHPSCSAITLLKDDCNLCGKPLKFGDKVYTDPNDPTQMQHSLCVWNKADAEVALQHSAEF